MVLTISLPLLLGIIIAIRLRRRTEARSKVDEKMTVAIVLAFGVMIAPTPAGGWVLEVLGHLANGVSDIKF